MSESRRFGGAMTKIADRHDAHELARVIDDVKIKERFQLAALADLIDGALGGGVGGERHEIGGHDSADRALGIIDDLADGGLTFGV